MMNRTTVTRAAISGGGCLLLALAFVGTRDPAAGQAAVSMSRPGQEDISFWITHNGMLQYDVEGETGFGDLARILLRRRANAEQIRELRDRFTFRVQQPGAIQTPDVFRAAFSNGKLQWLNAPQIRFIAAASRTFNIPVVVDNRDADAITVDAIYQGPSMESRAVQIAVPAHSAVPLFLRAVETQPGNAQGKLTLRQAAGELATSVLFEIRPLVTLRVRIVDERGDPAVARVYLTGADGLAYAPRGSSNRIAAMSAEYFFHADTAFALDM